MITIPRRDDWRIAELEEICDFQNGYAFRNSDYQKPEEDAYIVFKMGNIEKGGGLKHNPSNSFISRDRCSSLSRFMLNRGDIVMSMTDMKASMALLGHTAIIDEDDKYILNQRVGRITVKDPTTLDSHFLFYYTNSPAYINHLRGLAHSGVQVNLSTTDIKESPVVLPPLPVQRKIASVLSTYDDLIENNTRRIRILEEMAQSIYREWFVNFRFPGHEKVRMIDSKLGKIPKGWEITTIGNVADIYRGRSYRSENLVEVGGIPFINLKCIERNGGFRADGLKSYSGSFGESQTVSVNDIVVAVTDMTQERRLVAHAARIPCLSYGYAIYSMDLVKLKSKRTNWQEYLYGILRYSNFSDTVKQMANGVNVLHLSPLHIGTFEFVMAPQNVVEIYSEMLGPIYELEDNLELKNMCLRQTRDLLLPRLISGELNVSDLDISTNDTDGGSR